MIDKPETTPVMYALAMSQYHVVNWFEKEKGIESHRATPR